MPFTVSVYFPAGVAFGFGCDPPEVLPPPQEHMTRSKPNGTRCTQYELSLLHLDDPGSAIKPTIATAHSQPAEPVECGTNVAIVGDVVVTLTVNVETVVALTFSLAGTVHVAPVGAPVQVNDTVPLKPPPPIESI